MTLRTSGLRSALRLTHSHLSLSILTRRLGNGAYGVVVAAKDTVTAKAVAIKKCFNIFQSLSDAKKIAREVRTHICVLRA